MLILWIMTRLPVVTAYTQHAPAVSENHGNSGTLTINHDICTARFRGKRKARQSWYSKPKSRYLHGTFRRVLNHPRKFTESRFSSTIAGSSRYFCRGQVSEGSLDIFRVTMFFLFVLFIYQNCVYGEAAVFLVCLFA